MLDYIPGARILASGTSDGSADSCVGGAGMSALGGTALGGSVPGG